MQVLNPLCDRAFWIIKNIEVAYYFFRLKLLINLCNLLAGLISIKYRHVKIKKNEMIIPVLSISFFALDQLHNFLPISCLIYDVYIINKSERPNNNHQLECIIISNKNF